MAGFSERIGVKPPKTVLQLESMDDDLRNPQIHYQEAENYGDIFFKRLLAEGRQDGDIK